MKSVLTYTVLGAAMTFSMGASANIVPSTQPTVSTCYVTLKNHLGGPVTVPTVRTKKGDVAEFAKKEPYVGALGDSRRLMRKSGVSPLRITNMMRMSVAYACGHGVSVIFEGKQYLILRPDKEVTLTKDYLSGLRTAPLGN